MLLEKYLSSIQEAGFEKYPKGWDQSSVKKFAKSIGGDPKTKGWWDKCIKEIEGKIGNPEGFCASVRDEALNSTYWRGEGKSKKEMEKDIRTHKKIHK
jgi:hypothetical protein